MEACGGTECGVIREGLCNEWRDQRVEDMTLSEAGRVLKQVEALWKWRV